MDDIFQGLKAVVQYRRKSGGDDWHTMAAYDSHDLADRYAAEVVDGHDNLPWEYQVVDVEPRY